MIYTATVEIEFIVDSQKEAEEAAQGTLNWIDDCDGVIDSKVVKVEHTGDEE